MSGGPRHLLSVVVLTGAVATVGACASEDDGRPGIALCAEVERQGELRAEDITDVEAIAALVAELPEGRRTDAALFYYPYGGDIQDGVDTSGGAASEAGGRLYALYRQECGYEGP